MTRALLASVFIGIGVAALGCAVDVDLSDRGCSAEHACLAGYLCVEGACRETSELVPCGEDTPCARCEQGFCVEPLDDAGVRHDAGPGEDAGPEGDSGPSDGGALDAGAADGGAPVEEPDLCGSFARFVNDFEGPLTGDLSLHWGGAGTVSVTGGELEIALGDGSDLSSEGFVHSDVSYRASAPLIVEVKQVPMMNGTTAWLQMRDPSGDTAALEVKDGLLRFRVESPQGDQNPVIGSFDAVAHRFWRLGFASPELLVGETSSDGTNWQVVGSTGALDPEELYEASLGAGLTAVVPSAPTVARFDNLGGPPPYDVPSWCPLSSFSDDFEDGRLGSVWGINNYGCYATESGGSARLSCPEGTDGETYILANTAFDGRGQSLTAELPTEPPSGLTLHVGFTTSTWGFIGFTERNGELLADIEGHTSLGPYTLPSPRPAWRRVSFAENITFSTSVDGVEWQALGSINAPTAQLKDLRPLVDIWRDGSSPSVDVSVSLLQGAAN